MTPKTLNLINIALVLIIFPATALLVKDFLAYRFAVKGIEVTKPVGTAPERAAGIMEYAPITERPVFPSPAEKFVPLSGAEGMRATPARAADPSAVLSGLRLTGTYVGPRSFAVFIKTDGKIEGAFEPGEEVFDKGVLKEVTRDSAVIVSGGVPVTLKMPVEEVPLAELPTLRPGRTFPAPARRVAPQETRRPGQFKMSRKTGENEWVVSQEAVLGALEDMGEVLSSARLTPVREGADVTGFLITEIRPRGIMDAIGLKNGDILKRVNGYEITTPERAVQVLSALKGETSFDLDIVRGGVNKSFHYDIR
jgi:general secretion pathway protein C